MRSSRSPSTASTRESVPTVCAWAASSRSSKAWQFSASDGNGIVLTGAQDQVYGCFIGTTPGRHRGPRQRQRRDVGGELRDDRQLATRLSQCHLGKRGGWGFVHQPASGGFVTNSYIGTRKGGTVALGNGDDGVRIETSDVHRLRARSVISSNGGSGVHVLQPDGANNSKIQGNLIGTDATGAVALGNDIGCIRPGQ